MEKTFFYIVILGETAEANYNLEVERLKTLGAVQKITERTYGLTIKSVEVPDRTQLRKTISGDENYIAIVIRISANTNCSWCLFKESSEYLTGIYQTLYKELDND